MEYEGINSVVCDAEESDWLDISYSQRKYVEKPQKRGAKKFGRAWKVAIVVVLCVAVLSTMLLVDGDFKKEVFDAVKTAVASVFNRETDKSNTINIPCNVTLVNVEEGVMTFNGGRAAMSLTTGTVTEISDDSVTVAMDDQTVIVYGGLTSVMVNVSDEVSANSLLGKYQDQYTASILQNGQVVKQVVGSETQLIWNI